MDLLFNEGRLSGALENQERKMHSEVEGVPEDHLLHADAEALASALAEKYRVEVPVLDVSRRWLDEKEARIDVSDHPGRDIFRSGPIYVPGHEVQIHVPFTGERDVFRFTPSSFTLNPPRARVQKDELVQVITYTHDAPRDVLAISNGWIESIEQWLGWARADAEGTNSKLEAAALQAIENRKARLLENKKRLTETGIPIGRPSDDDKTRITEVIVRRPSPVARRSEAPLKLVPALPDQQYEHILDVIRRTGTEMERSPGTYEAMGEEDRRHVLLTALNTHYEGAATAEAFNSNGKTDILVRHENVNLFIGECKVWSGAKAMSDAIDQLLSYATWRDTKLALVIFIREKNLTAVVAKARETLEAHPQVDSAKNTKSDTEIRARVRNPGDDSKVADLAVLLFHAVPSDRPSKR